MTLRVSCKQLTMFGPLQRPSIGGCPRQWAFNYLDGLKSDYLPPPLVDGIKFHAVCASLVSTGRMPEPGELQPGVVLSASDVLPESHLGRLARAALIHVPVVDPRVPPRPWVVEHVGSFEWVTQLGTRATIDLRPDLINPLGVQPMSYLIDFKSTSDKKWALSELVNDTQANVYAHGLHLSGAETVFARWIYVQKTTYASWKVDRMFHPEATKAWLHENIDATIDLISTFREANVLGMDLPGDERACGGTGRFCDHGARCLGPVGARPAKLISLSDILRYKGEKQDDRE